MKYFILFLLLFAILSQADDYIGIDNLKLSCEKNDIFLSFEHNELKFKKSIGNDLFQFILNYSKDIVLQKMIFYYSEENQKFKIEIIQNYSIVLTLYFWSE